MRCERAVGTALVATPYLYRVATAYFPGSDECDRPIFDNSRVYVGVRLDACAIFLFQHRVGDVD